MDPHDAFACLLTPQTEGWRGGEDATNQRKVGLDIHTCMEWTDSCNAYVGRCSTQGRLVPAHAARWLMCSREQLRAEGCFARFSPWPSKIVHKNNNTKEKYTKRERSFEKLLSTFFRYYFFSDDAMCIVELHCKELRSECSVKPGLGL